MVLLCLLITVLIGCEKNPAGPKPETRTDALSVYGTESPSESMSDSLSTIIVTFEDKRENSSAGSIMPAYLYGNRSDNKYIFKSFIIENNSGVLDSVPPGNYNVRSPYDSSKDNPVIDFTSKVVLAGQKTVEVNFVVPGEIPLNARFTSSSTAEGEAVTIKGAEVASIPETVSLTTDYEGRAEFGTVPLQNFSFTITKYDITLQADISKILITDGQVETVDVTLPNADLQPPVMEIVSPEDAHYLNNEDILFIGDGRDFEDDALPDGSYVWYSSIDGELGTGKELSLDHLTVGNHTITLVGTDSHLMQGECSIQLVRSDLSVESYFPLPYTGYWNYNYETVDFFVTDDIRGDEQWSLDELIVSADDVDARTCIMEYTVTRGDTTKYCRYEVTDHYETGSGNIYITQTTEHLHIFDNESKSGEPTERLDIETVYSPLYLLMKQFMDPGAESSYETYGTVEITLNYCHANSITQTLNETMNISTYYETGEPVAIKTGVGTYDAVPFTIRSEGTERTWWLAEGIGVIRLAYDSFDLPLTATLNDTNVPSFSGVGPTVVAWKSSVSGNSRLTVFDSLPDSPERMMELTKFLRGLSPR
jgi:hypothetical protein